MTALRRALTSDDANERAEAYGTVYEAGLEPEQALKNQPDVEAFEAAGVIEEQSQAPSRAERDEQVVSLLEDIRDALTGSDSA